MADKQPAPKTDTAPTTKPKDSTASTTSTTTATSTTKPGSPGSSGGPTVQPDPHVREG